MRNLKKILALVLALVMSLSLMAAAGASSFPDVDDGNPYATAIEVLDELKVFQGFDDGTFKPTETLNRAQAAVLVYRIATGDVENKYLDNYTFMQQSKFTDLDGYNWAKGYINYCQNAGIVVGTSATTFDPGAKVTGYQLLVMLLRTLGYGKAGEFADPQGWELQTATIAEREGITRKVTGGDFGAPAPRQMVAEILFEGLLTETVTYSALISGGYTKGETLGKREFGLDGYEAVVVANEYADLNSNQVLAEGKTQVQVEGEDSVRTLSYGTKITDIGERRLIYTQNGSKVLFLADEVDGEKLNITKEYGDAVDVSTTTKFNTVAEMPAANDIEYYTNFDLNVVGAQWCDQRLEFSVVLYGPDAERSFDNYRGINISEIAADDNAYSVERGEIGDDGTVVAESWTRVTTLNDDYATADMPWNGTDGEGNPVNYAYRFTKIIFAGVTVTDTDLVVLESIFGTADNRNNNVLLRNRITGDVFVGTKSTATDTTLEERDLSNQISYKKFVEDYIKTNTDDATWSVTYNGWWTKFIDNDRDGKCDYAFRTWSSLDEVLHTYTNRDGETVTQFTSFDDNTYNREDNNRYTVRYLDDYTPAVGDKVIAAWIDNQILVEPAEDDTVTVSSYSWRNDEITTDKGVYKQSGIINNTDMQELISNMDEKVEYVVYFDHFGHVRAYELPGGTKYALITELYYTNSQNGNIQQDWPMTAELTIPTSDTEAETDEYSVASGAGTFTALQPWMRVANAVATYNYNNWLQPVLPNLGVDRVVGGVTYGPTKGTPTFAATTDSSNDNIAANAYVTFWPANRQLVRDIAPNGMSDPNNDASTVDALQEFTYGPQTFNALYANADGTDYNWSMEESSTFTNVAIVNVDEGAKTANLYGAAELNLNTSGGIASLTRPYSRNYIQLSTDDVAADAVRYNISGPGTYAADNNTYVNATHDTQYFIAYNGGVWYAKDFVNFPGLTNEKNQIHAAYAVARNTNSDADGVPYWVADVIVYEVYNLDDVKQTSVSLAYYTPTRTTGNVQEIETLNSKYGPQVTLQPKNLNWSADRGQWGAQWSGYGFYGLYNDSEPVDSVMTAKSISRINIGDYAKNKIYAGTIVREAYIQGAGQYIDVDMSAAQDGSKIAHIEITNKIYSITDKDALSDWMWNESYTYQYTVSELLRYESSNNSQVRKGDKVIWVGAANTNGTLSSTNFVVDLGNGTTNEPRVFDGMELLNATPTWLINRTWNSALGQYDIDVPTGNANQGEWQRIMWEQNLPSTDVSVIAFDLALGTGETISFSYDGEPVGDKRVYDDTDTQAILTLPGKDLAAVKLTLTTTAAIAAITPASGNWKVAQVTPLATGAGYDVVLWDNDQLKSVAPEDEAGTIYTVAKVEELIAEAEDAGTTLERKAEISEELQEIKDARDNAGANVEYAETDSDDADLDTTIGDEIDTLNTAVEGALDTAKTNAPTTIDEYEAEAIDTLSEAKQAELAELATAAKDAVEAAETVADVNAAIDNYKKAVDDALAAADPELPAKKTAAKTTVNEYEAAAVAALTGERATAAAEAKTTAEAAIEAAKTATAINDAVNAYKETVDALIEAEPDPNVVTITAPTGMTVEEVTIKKGEMLPETIVLVASASTALSDTAANYAIKMEGTDGLITPDNVVLSENDTKATLTLPMKEVTGNITITLRGATEKTPAAITLVDATGLTVDPATTYVGDELSSVTISGSIENKAVAGVAQYVMKGEDGSDGSPVSNNTTYDAETGVVTFTTPIDVTGAIAITLTLKDTYAVTAAAVVGDENSATVTVPQTVVDTTGATAINGVTITPAAGYGIKSVTVKVGDGSPVDATYVAPTEGQTAGKLTFSSTDINGAVTITVTTEKVFTVSVPAGFTTDVATVTATQAGSSVTITLTGKAADPTASTEATEVASDDVVAVTIGGTSAAQGTDYQAPTITAGSGTSGTIVIVFEADKITGDVIITVTPAGI